MIDLKTLSQKLSAQLNLPATKIKSAAELLADGNTIPFIARYRKEATGGLDEIALRAIEDGLETAKTLAARRKTILKTIEEQGALTDALRQQINDCDDLRALENLYLPYKPKRRTRATIAREKGLQPLADLLLAQNRLDQSRQQILKPFVNAKHEVHSPEEALAGALDIVAETWADDAELRAWVYEKAQRFGKVASRVKRGKKSAEGAEKFEQYFDRTESASRIPGHRFLAMQRGATEGILNVKLVFETDREVSDLKRRLVTNRNFEFFHDLLDCVEDCFKRLLLPATESSVMQHLKDQADDEAIEVFGKNLNDLLMAAPAGPQVTIGIDPGFRTGCKVAVVDQTGKFLEHKTIYPTAPRNDKEGAGQALSKLIQSYDVKLIAIGNGTASRETDAFVGELIKKQGLDVTKVIVSEAGASIYSASEVAAAEFPNLDLTIRGAISIARRLQDPLAELVKTDPKSIGVGQYQHDVNQSKLKKCLSRTVESCVNRVGVDLNMASASLLAHVAGIGPKLASNIVNYRNENGRFANRKQLNSVPKLGNKAFQQAAGFLRIRDGDQPLDNSAVHPESYVVVKRIANTLDVELEKLVGNANFVSQATKGGRLKADAYVDENFGLPTVKDIIAELAKPGRDPRSEFKAVRFNDQVNQISDLKPNMVLEGVITNVTHFGAFIDLGVHQDGLIHISQLANEFVSDPNEIVSVGDVCKVKVLEVDVDRKRISVTRKF